MDKLKENAYWISLGAVALVLLLLVWFLVVARIFGGSGATVSSLGDELEKSLASIEGYTRREHVPTAEYAEHLKAALERVRLDHNEGARWYNEARERFNQYFPGMSDPPDPGIFASTYHEKMKELIENYRKEFGIEIQAEDPSDKDKEPVEVPRVDRLDQSAIFAENVPSAMKEYWITEAIFEALTKLGLGGLKKVDFPGRVTGKDEEPESEYYATMEVSMSVEMPFSKIEDLVTALFEDDRVLFLFEGLESTKTVEHLKPYMTLKTTTDFDNRDEADRARYADVVPEPNVSVVLSFKVLDWKGLPEIERDQLDKNGEEEESGEEAEESGEEADAKK